MFYHGDNATDEINQTPQGNDINQIPQTNDIKDNFVTSLNEYHRKESLPNSIKIGNQQILISSIFLNFDYIILTQLKIWVSGKQV